MRKGRKARASYAKVESGIRAQLLAQYTSGMSVGVHAICDVLYEKATDKNILPEERLKNVVDFLERSKGIAEVQSEAERQEKQE